MRKPKKKNKRFEPSLCFGESSEFSGFTSAGVAGYNDLNPASVIREMMQNSLDAVRETDQKCACVRFELVTHELNEVPGIDQYRDTFYRAVKDQERKLGGVLSDQARDVVTTIEKCLAKDQCTTLFVLDNGIGLDGTRMGGILADGLSVKTFESTGAVGNGHFVVVPASDLRYILYGGLTKEGQTISSGHAILASHQYKRQRRSKDGFYVKEIRNNFLQPYEFPQSGEIPNFIKTKLEWISDQQMSSGTVVAVPGFNHFREPKSNLWDVVSRSAACNFFSAFEKAELSVELVCGDRKQVLDSSNIQSTLKRFSGEKRRSKRNKFLTGYRAFSAFETVKTGDNITIETDVGSVSMKLRELTDGDKSRIDLCRNGMWITDDLGGKLRESQFTGLKPFHCVLLLDAQDGEISRLIRKAEGPLHCDLTLSKLQTVDRKKVNQVFATIALKLHEIVPKYDTEQFKVHDVLSITTHGVSSGGRRSSMVGGFQELQRPRRSVINQNGKNTEDGPGEFEPEKTGKGNGTGTRRGGRSKFRRQGNAIQFRALAIPTDTRSCRVDLIPDEKAAGSEVRFSIDESLDESCDDVRVDNFVRIKSANINGQQVTGSNLTQNINGEVLGILLGSVEPGEAVCVEIDYELPGDGDFPDDDPIVLKAELIRRSARPVGQEEN